MCQCCSDIKHSFLMRKIIIPITLLANIGLMLYFIISNVQNYEKYQTRASYTVYHVPNTTSNYYIIRTDLNDTLNCSKNALFTFDIRTVFQNIISKHETLNTLFISVFWLSLIVATLLSLFDLGLSIKSHCSQHENDDLEFENCTSSISIWASLIGSQFLQKGSFLFPTYFIGIFDFNELCLSHHTKESLFILHHTYICILISLFSMIYLVLWTWACWDTHRHEYYTDSIWDRCIHFVTCGNEKASYIIFFLLCVTVILIGVYGMFVWITSLMEYFLKTKAILICCHFLLGIFHEIIKHCRH